MQDIKETLATGFFLGVGFLAAAKALAIFGGLLRLAAMVLFQ